MPQLLTLETFGRGGAETGRRQVIYSIGTGTAVIEVRDQHDQTDADYIAVPDSSFAIDATFTVYAEAGFIYRVVLTGDAEAYLSGKPKR